MGLCLIAVPSSLAGCTRHAVPPTPVPDPCAALAADFARQAREVLTSWEEAEAVTLAAEGDALGVAIARLTVLRAQFNALDPPECALGVKVRVTQYMDLTIDVQNATWSDDCRLCIEETKAQAAEARKRALYELGALEGAS